MAPRIRIAVGSICFAFLLAASARAASPTFPTDVTLNEVLGFRTRTGLSAPFVFPRNNYLGKGAKLQLLDSHPAFGTAGAFCKAKAAGKVGYIRCDKPSAFTFANGDGDGDSAAPAQGGGDSASSAPANDAPAEAAPAAPPPRKAGKVSLGQYCSSVDTCKNFCQKYCKLNLNAWKSTCNLPKGMAGSIPKGSSELKKIPSMRFIKADGGVQATDTIIDGLKRADAYIGSYSSWPSGATLQVHNCYRSDELDSTNECDYILKGWHIKDKWSGKTPATKKDKDELATGNRLINPPTYLGLTWPGATPHSAGIGCDIVVRVGNKDVTSCKSTPAMQQYSKALVDVLTNAQVGGVRLNYENWHFEWGGALTGCRCKGADCNDHHWPTQCDGPQHCAHP